MRFIRLFLRQRSRQVNGTSTEIRRHQSDVAAVYSIWPMADSRACHLLHVPFICKLIITNHERHWNLVERHCCTHSTRHHSVGQSEATPPSTQPPKQHVKETQALKRWLRHSCDSTLAQSDAFLRLSHQHGTVAGQPVVALGRQARPFGWRQQRALRLARRFLSEVLF